MAKIFRKIRQQFLAEDRIKKYLLYAIGEIILVVIGILVALQINAVNQNWQRAKLEKVLLKQIKFEILEIYEDIWRDTENLKLGYKSHYNISNYIEQDHPYTDSLCFDFYWLAIDEYAYPTSASYSRIKEIGLDIIQNDSIRIALQSLYEGYFPRLVKSNAALSDITNTFNDYYLNSFKPNTNLSLKFKFHLPNDTVGNRIYADVSYEFPNRDQHGKKYTIGYVPLDFEALKKDPKFQMLLVKTKRYRGSKLNHYRSVQSTIKEVIKIIERELNKAS